MKEILFTLSFKKLTRIYLNKILLFLFLPAVQCNPFKRNENILSIIQQSLKDSIKLPTTHLCIGDSLVSQLIKNPPATQETLVQYLLQYSWISLVAQLLKNRPAMPETWNRSLGWEDPLKKRKATHSSILAQRIPWTVYSMRSQRVRHD